MLRFPLDVQSQAQCFYVISNFSCISVSVQNGSIHQKDAVNDDDFEPYLSSQTNQAKKNNGREGSLKPWLILA
uniref:Uncharacterized protein n=1 Tax=Naja naja TaxID=35670 RepID=A0A8C6XCE1_NAJNA